MWRLREIKYTPDDEPLNNGHLLYADVSHIKMEASFKERLVFGDSTVLVRA
jgi:hypothetical protein